MQSAQRPTGIDRVQSWQMGNRDDQGSSAKPRVSRPSVVLEGLSPIWKHALPAQSGTTMAEALSRKKRNRRSFLQGGHKRRASSHRPLAADNPRSSAPLLGVH